MDSMLQLNKMKQKEWQDILDQLDKDKTREEQYANDRLQTISEPQEGGATVASEALPMEKAWTQMGQPPPDREPASAPVVGKKAASKYFEKNPEEVQKVPQAIETKKVKEPEKSTFEPDEKSPYHPFMQKALAGQLTPEEQAKLSGEQDEIDLMNSPEWNTTNVEELQPEQTKEEDKQIIDEMEKLNINFNNPLQVYTAYQALKQRQIANLNYMRAADKASQGITTLFGGDLPSNKENIDILEKQASGPLDDYEQLLKALKTAKDSKSYPKQTIWMVRDEEVGKYIPVIEKDGILHNSRTNKPIDFNTQDIVARTPQVDPYGGRSVMGSQGLTQIDRGSYGGKATTVEEFKLKGEDPTQTKALKEAKDAFAKNSSVYNKALGSAQRLIKTINSGSKLTGSVVKAQMPRVNEEVGNLNAQEQAMWEGALDIFSKIEQFADTKLNSELTPSNKKELLKLLQLYSESSQSALNRVRQNTKKQLKMSFAIPEEYTEEYLGQQIVSNSKPYVRKPDERIKFDPSTGEQGLYKIVNENGKQKEVFIRNLESFEKVQLPNR